MSYFIKKIVIISIFFFISFKAYAACKFELELGDKVSKIEKKYGPPFPLEFVGDDQLGMIAADADEVCPNHSLKDVALSKVTHKLKHAKIFAAIQICLLLKDLVVERLQKLLELFTSDINFSENV